MRNTFRVLLVSAAFVGLSGCKTASTNGSNLEAASKPSENNVDIFTCYDVMNVDTQSHLAMATKIKENAKKVCITNNPTTLTITDQAGTELLKWNFTGKAPLRCPGCFQLTGGQEYSGTISRTIAYPIFNMSLDSRGLGGSMKLTLKQIIEKQVGEEINGCYKVTDISTEAITAAVSELKNNAERVCVSQNPLKLVISDKDGSKELLSWQFTHFEPLRCPHCYVFRGGKDYSATIAAMYTPKANLTLDTRGFGGSVKMNLEKESE